MALPYSVLSQSGSPKSVGGGGGGRGEGGRRGGGGGWLIYRGGNLSMVSKVTKLLVVCLFWGGCHHPNSMRKYDEKNFINHIWA